MSNRKAWTLALWIVGCGADGGPVTAVGQSIWNKDVKTLILENQGGGFVPPAPAGSECELGSGRYSLTAATGELSWVRCQGDYQSMMPYTKLTGQRVLTEAELKDLSPTLEKLTVVADEDQCGADKPTLAATVITARGTQAYGDSFYSCTIKDRPLLQSGALDQALQSVSALAK